MLTATINAKAVTLEELQKGDGGWFTIKPAVTIVALCWDRYSYHRCVECRMRAIPNAEGKYGCAKHPAAKTQEIYCLRILLRQDDFNMWVTAFADVAELIRVFLWKSSMLSTTRAGRESPGVCEE